MMFPIAACDTGGLPVSPALLYDRLTPLRDDIDPEDLTTHFLDQNFAPIGETRVEDVGRR